MVTYTIDMNKRIIDIVDELKDDKVRSRVYTIDLFNQKIRVELL